MKNLNFFNENSFSTAFIHISESQITENFKLPLRQNLVGENLIYYW